MGWSIFSRLKPEKNEFEYDVVMTLIDLGELGRGALERWPLFSSRTHFALSGLDVKDHMEGAASVDDLDNKVRNLVQTKTGHRPKGRIALLTNLRYLGTVFSPVSFFYVFNDEQDDVVDAVVSEVTNIPWFQQHCYVAVRPPSLPDTLASTSKMLNYGEQVKEFHVSPFIKVQDIVYHFRFNDPNEVRARCGHPSKYLLSSAEEKHPNLDQSHPAEVQFTIHSGPSLAGLPQNLLVNISLDDDGRGFFNASLDLYRRNFSVIEMLRTFRPLATLQIIGAILYVSVFWKSQATFLKSLRSFVHENEQITSCPFKLNNVTDTLQESAQLQTKGFTFFNHPDDYETGNRK